VKYLAVLFTSKHKYIRSIYSKCISYQFDQTRHFWTEQTTKGNISEVESWWLQRRFTSNAQTTHILQKDPVSRTFVSFSYSLY